MYRLLSSFFVVFLVLSSFNVSQAAPQISQSQLEMFKKLPKSQQEALAKKYGVDIDTILSPGQNKDQGTKEFDYTPHQKQTEQESETSLFPEDDYYKPEELELKRFGEEFFQPDISNITTATVQSSPNDYLISIGDELSITLFGKQNEQHSVVVDNNGSVVVPSLEPINVIGLSLAEVKELVAQQVETQLIGVKSLVSISQLQPIKVYISGEVVKPGPYVLPPLSTISTAISFAGGISEVGSYREVSVKRNGELVAEFDLYDLLVEGSNADDITLRTGDVVLVPTVKKLVNVEGSIKREAIYELSSGETLADAIAYAGGFSHQAYTDSIRIHSSSGSGSKVIKNVARKNLGKFELADGDQVFVPEKTDKASNSIYLIGASSRPGQYQWYEGIRLSDLLGDPNISLLPNADLNYGLVVRSQDNGNVVIKQFSPINILDSDEQNHELKPHDQVVIFSSFELKQQELAQLRKKALTKQELKNLQNRLRWDEYKQYKFEQYTAKKEQATFGEELEVTSKKLSKQDLEVFVTNKYPIYLSSLQEDVNEFNSVDEAKEFIENELTVFSRSKLLSPILDKLATQGGQGQPASIVEISGSVKYPGLYPISESATVKDVVKAAGGLLEGTYLEQAEITRIQTAGKVNVENVTFSLKSALSSKASDYELQGRDYINIFKAPNWQENQVVELVGEVLLPGKYTIKRGETLKSVIERAGGFTEYAQPNAAVFTRESLKEQEQKYLQDLSEALRREVITNNLNTSDSILSTGSEGLNDLIQQLSETEAVGRLIIDLDEVMSGDTRLVLENMDTLYVPTERQSVNVIGEVYVATSHLFKPGYGIDEYINLSGGYKDKAAMEKVYVIKANGQVVVPEQKSWFSKGGAEEQIAAGDTIVVPLDSAYKDNLTLWTQVTQIVYQLGVAVAAVGSL
ncbi:SLBB domain-containing protein [Pseudoalteromonas ruthenica]|uniref:SLBB domain-containing protein n=1 Tax=Pseudoalteromonas ruthenica TaxID=151081 RepID=UPI0012492F22|nr:SLBB domain-containing protein [Pseudoalteromonas ruthenica]